MSQFLRDQASDSDEVVTPLMLDGTYLSRNFATLGPGIRNYLRTNLGTVINNQQNSDALSTEKLSGGQSQDPNSFEIECWFIGQRLGDEHREPPRR